MKKKNAVKCQRLFIWVSSAWKLHLSSLNKAFPVTKKCNAAEPNELLPWLEKFWLAFGIWQLWCWSCRGAAGGREQHLLLCTVQAVVIRPSEQAGLFPAQPADTAHRMSDEREGGNVEVKNGVFPFSFCGTQKIYILAIQGKSVGSKTFFKISSFRFSKPYRFRME